MSVALVVGLSACDSGGTNTDDSNGDTDDEIAGTFEVTVQDIDDTYPYRDRNEIGVAYALNGEVGREITLERGETYEFILGEGVDPSHPFFIGETAQGGPSGEAFSEGVENAGATTGSVFVTPPDSAPDSLYYVCESHVYMGGKMTITDSSGDNSSSGDDDDGSGGY